MDLLTKIGPHTFFIIFFVMDIYPSYICFLGRSWIHSAKAITSTLHQRLKLLVSNKLVVVEGEEDIMVSDLASFRYMEGRGEVKEIPFQSFEIVNVQMVGPIGEVNTVIFMMASLKDDQTITRVDTSTVGEGC